MAYRYSDMEYFEMIRVYYDEADTNMERTVRFYRDFSVPSLRSRGIENPRVPSAPTVLAAVQRWREWGQLRTPNHALGNGRPSLRLSLEERILDYFERNPCSSTRRAAVRFDVSHGYVWNLLNSTRQHPYHFQRVQALYRVDNVSRREFCEWLLDHQDVNILWTDEAMFTRVALYNIHNEHWWAYQNPHAIKENNHQERFSVNVWAGIIGNHIIGPHFIEGHLSGGTYLDMLTRVIPTLMDDIPLGFLRNIVYQHDGAPAHYSRSVREHLNQTFEDRWIGRGGPVPWPARSPDLTPLDYFFWGEAKRLVYREEAHNVQDLKNKICAAFEILKVKTLDIHSLKSHTLRRAQLCVERNGLHFEQLL